MYKFLLRSMVVAVGVLIGNLLTEQVKDRAHLE